MRCAMKHIMIASMILAASTGSQAAEPLKFRQMAPIYVDGKGAGIRQPESVACRGNALVVADTGNGRLLRYTIAGDTWTPSGEIVPSTVTISDPRGDEFEGGIFALDGSSRKIVRVAPTGEFLGYFAPAGDVQGTVVPRSLRIARDDSVYLLDVSAARVLVLDPSGKILREVPFPKGYGFFSDLAVDVGGISFCWTACTKWCSRWRKTVLKPRN